MNFDPVHVIERGYEPVASGEAWLERLAHEVIPHVDPSWVTGAAFVATVPGPPDHVVPVVRSGSRVDPELTLTMVSAAHLSARPEQMMTVLQTLRTPGVASVVDLVGELSPGILATAPVPVQDSLAVFVHAGAGKIVLFATVNGKRVNLDAGTRRLWQRIALHLGAGRRLLGRAASPDAADVEAVLEPGGALAHASGEARTAQHMLRDAVRNMDRARTREGRKDPMQALELWRGLLAGRWTLVDHFDSDGRRFVLARKNDPDVPEPRALTRRQRQVVFYASLGWSNKEICYALGLSENTVSAHLAQSLTKLGITTRAELVRMATEVALAAASPFPSP
ncbi:MAG: LuxR C-terminal-related transcriptional regulator [Polyangiaceae bacterium]